MIRELVRAKATAVEVVLDAQAILDDLETGNLAATHVLANLGGPNRTNCRRDYHRPAM